MFLTQDFTCFVPKNLKLSFVCSFSEPHVDMMFHSHTEVLRTLLQFVKLHISFLQLFIHSVLLPFSIYDMSFEFVSCLCLRSVVLLTIPHMHSHISFEFVVNVSWL